MPPQPLGSVCRNANTNFSSEATTARPELAAIVLSVIGSGAVADVRWSVNLINLLSADPVTGMAMYRALTSADAQRAALLAAAKSRLPQEDALVVQAALNATASFRRLRNEFAHGLWGTAPELPDSILLATTECFIAPHLHGAVAVNEGWDSIPEMDKTSIRVYNRTSLQEALASAKVAVAIACDTTGVIWEAVHRPQDDPLAAESRAQARWVLLNWPQVEQVHRKLIKQNAQ